MKFAFNFRLGLCLAALLSLFAGQAMAQVAATSGSLQGTVKDVSGAVVPGASVRVTSTETGVTRVDSTDQQGNFNVPLLPVGHYDVTISKSGFQSASLQNVEIHLSNITNASFVLKVGANEQKVNVSATGGTIDTAQSHQVAVVGNRSITDLPLLDRNFASFVYLTPGAVQSGARSTQAIGGGKGINTNYTIDGADRNNPFFGGQAGGDRPPFVISEDAIQEFVVENNGFSAEFGRSQGGLVNVVTKSGTNQFHGDAFYYLKPHNWQRTDELGYKASGRRQQFGGSVGGPIVKDKLFFFTTTDNQREFFPEHIQFGDQQALLAAAAAGGAQAAAANAFLSQQTTVNGTNNLYSLLTKIDWYQSARSNFSFRYNWSHSVQDYGTYTGGSAHVISNAPSANGIEGDYNYEGVLQWNFIVSPNAVNEFRAHYNFENRPRENVPVPGNSSTVNGVTGGAAVYVSGVGNLGAVYYLPIPEHDDRLQFTDNYSYQFGQHDLKIGTDYNLTRVTEVFRGNSRGNWFFSNFNNWVSQTPSTFTQFFGNGAINNAATTEPALYAQDEWKLTPRLTLSYGLRWEGQFNPTNPHPNQTAIFTPGTSKIPSDATMFQPRVGISWDPTGKGTDVVRLNGGIFYSHTPALLYFNTFAANGDVSSGVSYFGSGSSVPSFSYPFNGPYPTPYSSFPGTVSVTSGTLPGSSVNEYSPNFRNSKTYRGGANYEHSFGSGWSASASYSIAYSENLERLRDINLSPCTVDAVGRCVYSTANRPITFPDPTKTDANGNPVQDKVGSVTLVESTENAHYQAMSYGVKKSYSHGFMLQAYYTYARDFSSNDNERDANGKAYADPFRRLDWGPSALDVRHQFVASGVAHFFTLEFAPILTLYSGSPFNVTTGTSLPYGNAHATAPNPTAVARLLSLLGDPSSATVVGYGNGDPNSTSRPIINGVMLGRDALRGPGFANMDLRIARAFQLTERQKLDIRLDLFNTFNLNNWTVANTQITSKDFADFTQTPASTYQPLAAMLSARWSF